MVHAVAAAVRGTAVRARALAARACVALIALAGTQACARAEAAQYTLAHTLAVTTISASDGHTCASMENGEVDCWGLEYVTRKQTSVPVRVAGVSGAIAVSAGKNFNCAVLASSQVSCWGDDGYGQLGDGRTEDSATPTQVVGLSGAVAVSAGGYHACAVRGSGAVVCWGRNNSGALGSGSNGNSSVPVAVRGINNAVAVSAGNVQDETCALLSSGHVRCWGSNARGQLGNGSTHSSDTPVTVRGIAGAVSVAAGGDHVCAALASGAVACWGGNARGQLGDGSTRSSSVPVRVKGITSARAVSVDARGYSCAVLSSGSVYCWGFNSRNQLGDGRWPQGSSVPVQTLEVSNAVAITAGRGHGCALLATGAADCWGYDDYGQLGKGGGRPRICNATPVRFPTLTPQGSTETTGHERPGMGSGHRREGGPHKPPPTPPPGSQPTPPGLPPTPPGLPPTPPLPTPGGTPLIPLPLPIGLGSATITV